MSNDVMLSWRGERAVVVAVAARRSVEVPRTIGLPGVVVVLKALKKNSWLFSRASHLAGTRGR